MEQIFHLKPLMLYITNLSYDDFGKQAVRVNKIEKIKSEQA